MGQSLTPRDKRRLQQAYEAGYLDATLRDNRAVVKAFGLWCWRMRLPMVWFERRSPSSRFATLRLDMMTTPHVLTGVGRSALEALEEGAVSAHDALWERVPVTRAPKLAHAALRAALQVPNYRLNRTPAKIDARRGLRVVTPKIASA